MTDRRVMGIVVSETKPDRWMREQKLRTGPGIPSETLQIRYSADPMDARMYRAEREFRIQVTKDWPGWERMFVDHDHAQVYVDLVLAQDWPGWTVWPLRLSPTHLRAAHYRGAAYFPVGDQRWLRELIVLHEIAHHLTQTRGEHHGPRFVDAFAALLAGMLHPGIRDLFLTLLNGERSD